MEIIVVTIPGTKLECGLMGGKFRFYTYWLLLTTRECGYIAAGVRKYSADRTDRIGFRA